MLKLQTYLRCFLVCFALVRVLLSLWSVFIESLGSNSRCRVSNGVMPRVMGPTSFYLKIWVNILTIRMLLRSQDEHQNVAVFFIRMLEIHDVLHLGSSWMNVGWISGLAQHVVWDLFEFYPPKSSFSICFKSCWKSRIKWTKSVLDFVQEREDSGLQLQAHASRRFAWFCSEYKLSLMQDLLLLPFTSFYQLHCSWLEACAEVNILIIRMFHLCLL